MTLNHSLVWLLPSPGRSNPGEELSAGLSGDFLSSENESQTTLLAVKREANYQLPSAGEALSRMGSQIQQFAQWASQAPNREVVVWALKSPEKLAEAEQAVLQAAGNPHGVRFVYGVEGHFEYLSLWAGF